MDRTSIDIAVVKGNARRRERNRRIRGSVKRRWNCDSYIYESLLDKDWRKRNAEGTLRVCRNGLRCSYTESFVNQIREAARDPKQTYRSLARRFHISHESVGRVLGSIYKWRGK